MTLENNFKLGKYNVKFNRFNESKTVTRGKEEMVIDQKKTTCTITNTENDTVVANETVALHVQDEDSRNLGREFAFKKAMKNIELDKAERRIVWNDYLNYIGIVEKESEFA